MEETEAKIKLVDQDGFLNRLGEDLEPLGPPFHLYDTYFDLPALDFKTRDNVLRLRQEGSKTLIAYKGPRLNHRHLISRQEEETEVVDYDVAYRIVTGIGFQPIEVVEKRRQRFAHKRFVDLKVFLDILPFVGTYLEVEGVEESILIFLQLAGIDIQEATRKNYTEIFLEFCRSEGIHLTNPKLQLTFADEGTYRRTTEG